MLKKCKRCGREFEVKGPQKYCSDKCFKEHRKEYKANRYDLICDWCGKEFKGSYKEQRFCSTECQYEWQRESDEYKAHTEKLKAENKPQLIKEFKNKFEDKFPNFKYHSNYTGADNKFKMQCRVCGYIQERNAQCVRPSRDKELQCDNCEKIRLKEKRTKEKKEREKREKTILRNRLIKLIKNEVERLYKEPLLYKSCKRCGKEYKANAINSIHCDKCIEEIKQEERIERKEWEGKTIKCDECGKEFEMKRADSRFCSTKCGDKYFYRKKEIERREQLKENGRINYSVTLDKLIERDNGICQICNKPIDKNDYKVTDEGYFIVGNNYPSLDHIIPVAKGGTHTWDNVQLAHHHCNSIKSDKMII